MSEETTEGQSSLELEVGLVGRLRVVVTPVVKLAITAVNLVNGKTIDGRTVASPSTSLSSSQANQSLAEVALKVLGTHTNLPTEVPLPATLEYLVLEDGVSEPRTYSVSGELAFSGSNDFEFKQRVGQSARAPVLDALAHRLFGKGRVRLRLQAHYPHVKPVTTGDIATFDNQLGLVFKSGWSRLAPNSSVLIGAQLEIELQHSGLTRDYVAGNGVVRMVLKELDDSPGEKRGKGGYATELRWTKETGTVRQWMVGCEPGSTPASAHFSYEETNEQGDYEYGYDAQLLKDVALEQTKKDPFITVVSNRQVLKVARPTVASFQLAFRPPDFLTTPALIASGRLTGIDPEVRLHLEVRFYRRVGKVAECLRELQCVATGGSFEVEVHPLQLTPPYIDPALESLGGRTKAAGSPVFATLRMLPGDGLEPKLPLSASLEWNDNLFDAFDDRKGVVCLKSAATARFVCSIESKLGCYRLRTALSSLLGPVPLLNLEQLQHVFPSAATELLQGIVDEIVANPERLGLDTPLRRAHFFAQARKEAGASLALVEDMNYTSADRLRLFNYYRLHRAEAEDDVGHPKTIGDKVYGSTGNPSLGNGPEEGYRYRGRGMLHVTGKANYAAFTQWHDGVFQEHVDFVATPELLAQPKYALRAAASFWMRHRLAEKADTRGHATVDAITTVINAGEPAEGRKERRDFYDFTSLIFDVDASV